jgi:hypothetical protein
MVAIVDVTDVSPPQCLHDVSELAALARSHQQVDVVGHQDVGVDHASFPLRSLLQFLQVPDVVDIGKEAGLAVVAALDDVWGDPG